MRQDDCPTALARPPSTALVGIAAVVVAVMLCIVGWTLLDAHHAMRSRAETEVGNNALTVAREIERAIATLDVSLRAAAQGMQTPGLMAMAPELRRALLFNGAQSARALGGVLIADETGRVILDSIETATRGIDISSRGYFRAHRAAADLGLTISAPLRSLRDGEWIVALSRRINHADGTFAGVALSLLKLGYLQSLLAPIDLGRQGIIVLANTDRLLLARRPLADRDVGRLLADSAMFHDLATSPAGRFEAVSSVDHVRRLYAYHQVGNLPLVLGAGISIGDIYAQWWTKAAITAGVLLVLSGVGLVMARLVVRELGRRVRAEAAARRAAASAEGLAAELANTRAPLEALFRNSIDAMASVRVSPDGTFAYEAVNLVWETGLGAAVPQGAWPTADGGLPPTVADLFSEKWRECLRVRRPILFHFDTCWPLPPGHWEGMVVPIAGERGDIGQLIVFAREVTEQNGLATRLRQTQKLEVVGRLAAGVSHDFNNILQVITGGLDILRDEAPVSPAALMTLEMTARAAQRGAHLTHHLLAYSRKQMLNPKLLDLALVLEDLRTVLIRTLGTHIVVTIDVAPATRLVRADRQLLETALMNLAINAADAMPTGGALRFEVARAEAEPFGELVPSACLVIAVTDTGCGMPPDVLANAFEPFFTTKGSSFSGLGLPMVQGFSRQSGGDFRVTSKVGEGTRCEIWLPAVGQDGPVAAEKLSILHSS